MTLNVGVVGTGKIGQEHIRRLTETLAGARIVAMSDADAARAKEVAAKVPGAKAYPTGEELIAAERRRRGHRHVVGRYARSLCGRGDPGRQTGLLREADGDDRSGLLGDPRCGSRLRQAARPDRVHAPLRRAISGNEGDSPEGRDRSAADVPQHPSQRVLARPFQGDHGDHRYGGARHRHCEVRARRRAGRDLGQGAARQQPRGRRRRPAVHADRHALGRAGDDRDLGPRRLWLRHSRRGDRRNRNGEPRRAERDRRQDERGLFGPRLRRLARTVRRRLRRRVPRLDRGRRQGRRGGSERLGRLCRDGRHACRA